MAVVGRISVRRSGAGVTSLVVSSSMAAGGLRQSAVARTRSAFGDHGDHVGISCAAWRILLSVGPFPEEFFIDYVDTDYCLRCREAGRLIAVSNAARLVHAFGARDRRRSWDWRLLRRIIPASRHYYIARNRIAMIRRHAIKQFHWFFSIWPLPGSCWCECWPWKTEN